MHLFAEECFDKAIILASCLIILMSLHHLKFLDHLLTTFLGCKIILDFVTWTNSSVLDCMMFALLEVVD